MVWIYGLISLASLIALVFVIATFRSPALRVSRTVLMKCSPEKAFQQVNDLRLMNAWNPFLKLDGEAKVTYSGSESGPGAVCSWDGNSNVGAGKETIIASQPGRSVQLKLEFFRPFPGVNDVEFTFVPQGSLTDVTWCMTGNLALVPRLVGLFFSMEKMIGNNFLKGLNDMKQVVEA